MSDLQPEQKESIGRIEVAPEVIVTIAYYATIAVEGVAQTVSTSSGRFRRAAVKYDGVSLIEDGEDLQLDIHLSIKPRTNMVETAHAVQKAVYEAIDQMVGIPIQAVHVHVDNVSEANNQPLQPD